MCCERAVCVYCKFMRIFYYVLKMKLTVGTQVNEVKCGVELHEKYTIPYTSRHLPPLLAFGKWLCLSPLFSRILSFQVL